MDLGTLGGRWSTASEISDSGIIVGYSETASGEVHAVMWAPTIVPEPISSALFVIGGTLLAGRRYLRRKA